MKTETKALRYVDVICEDTKHSIGVEYSKFEKHLMYMAWLSGYKEALKDVEDEKKQNYHKQHFAK